MRTIVQTEFVESMIEVAVIDGSGDAHMVDRIISVLSNPGEWFIIGLILSGLGLYRLRDTIHRHGILEKKGPVHADDERMIQSSYAHAYAILTVSGVLLLMFVVLRP